MAIRSSHTRRDFILSGTIAGSGFILACLPAVAAPREEQTNRSQKEEQEEQEISPGEDLMREHGVLERILLIYEESIRRLSGGGEHDLGSLSSAANIVRSFIEDYHEKLEEDHLFPKFEKAGKLVDLVKLLRDQHNVGRRLTDKILALSGKSPDSRQRDEIVEALKEFIRMYRPHYAREDTVLFPAMHSIVSAEAYDAMGEQFEDQEHKLFGESGFEGIVEQVGGIEKTLGIYDLSKFSGKV